MDARGDLTTFILAGGKSTRMGRDKAWVELEGQTLLARALTLARSVSDSVRIVGSREKFEGFAPVVEDVFPDCGPLAAIHAALQSSSTDLNLILAVDTPFLTPEFLRFLIDGAEKARKALATVPRVGGWQPLCACYRRRFAAGAEKALRAGRYRIDLLFELNQTRVIEKQELEEAGFSESIFRNLNTPEELAVSVTGNRQCLI